jgi:hypothetical protein
MKPIRRHKDGKRFSSRFSNEIHTKQKFVIKKVDLGKNISNDLLTIL